MKDMILDFIEDHRKAVFITIGIVVVIAIMFGVRSSNAKKKAKLEEQQRIEAEQQAQAEEQARLEAEKLAAEEEAAKQVDNTPSYESSLNQKVETKRDETKVKEDEKIKDKEEVKEIKPNFEVTCNVFTHTEVPKTNVDGSSCKNYLNSVNLVDFGTFWGTKLDVNDMKSETKYLVGVDQDDIDVEVADLQSVGWLITNLDKLGKHDAIKFTNLHVIGSLSDDHLAVLCSYDWYSAFGLKDTLVLFEDISGTLDKKDFKDGSVFSALAFVHNMKIVRVNGQNVVCVQYNVY